MLEILCLDGNEWDEVWRLLPDSQKDVFARRAYYEAFSVTDRAARAECAVLHGERGILAYPYFRRPLAAVSWLGADEASADLVTAYGYGGIYGNTEDAGLIDEFALLFGERCSATGVVAELIRLNPLLGADVALSRHYRIQTGNRQVVVDLQRSDEEIWRSYRHNNRKNVNKARRSGVEVTSEDVGGPRFMDFLEIYGDTMYRRGAREGFLFPWEFYETLGAGLGDRCRMFYSIADEQTVSAEMVLCSETALYSFLGGTREEFFELRPNNLLKHEIILWGRDRGFRSFLLGGGPGGDDGIFDYKRSFAPDGIVDFHIATRIHDEAAYTELIAKCASHPPTAVPAAENYVLRWRYGE